MAKGKIWKHKEVLKTNVHEFLYFICHKIDKNKTKTRIMKGATNVIG